LTLLRTLTKGSMASRGVAGDPVDPSLRIASRMFLLFFFREVVRV